MPKLSVLKNTVIPTKRTGAKKNLLKKDGLTSSDGVNDNDDGSSSLSERQEKKKPRSKKKFHLNFFRRGSARQGAAEDGHDESVASTGSTRSTSSSFLRYQNRALWRARLMKKSVLRRLGDGSEAPLEEETKPWMVFDRVYKRQNQVLRKGEVGDEEELEYDEDSVSSVGSKGDAPPLGPPPPVAAIGLDEAGSRHPSEDDGTCEVFHEIELPRQGVCEGSRSLVEGGSPDKRSEESKEIDEISPKDNSGNSQAASEADKDKDVVHSVGAFTPDKGVLHAAPESISPENGTQIAVEKESADPSHCAERSSPEKSLDAPLKSTPSSPLPDSHAARVQTSDTPMSDTPQKETAPRSAPQPRTPRNKASKDPSVLPAPKLAQTSTPGRTFKGKKSVGVSTPDMTAKGKKPAGVRAKSSRKARNKKKPSDEEREEILPLSIPRTIGYSLRSAIGDGSARQRNSHSLMERRPLRPNGCHLDASYWSHRGKRNYMEDRFVMEHIGKNSESNPISLLAVFDGHGGSLCSNFCSDWISAYIRKKNEYFPDRLGLAMKTAFIKADADFVRSGNFDGSTACACAVVGKKVICCNSGDSRAIIVRRDGTAVALSEDHKPDLMRETKRINALGGRVIHWGRWRVEGVLAVSRSIGDARLKPYVTAEPDVIEHELGEDDMFLVVASDGVWDTMSNDLVAKFVIVNTCNIVDKSLNIDNKLLHWIARQVSKRARENGSSDNISIIVARLNDN